MVSSFYLVCTDFFFYLTPPLTIFWHHSKRKGGDREGERGTGCETVSHNFKATALINTSYKHRSKDRLQRVIGLTPKAYNRPV